MTSESREVREVASLRTRLHRVPLHSLQEWGVGKDKGARHSPTSSPTASGGSLAHVKAEMPKKSESRTSRSPDSRRAERAIPPDVRKLGRILLDQQMWCFGRDISRPSGNALIAYGFSKEPPPDGTNAPSCYVRKEPGHGRETRLWGFGIVYSEEGVGSIFLERRKFSPKLLPGGRLGGMAWRASEMPRCRMPRTEAETAAGWRLLGGVSARLSEYEAWIRGQFGEEYRRRCVASWPKKPVLAEGMPEAWMELARFFGSGEPISAARFG